MYTATNLDGTLLDGPLGTMQFGMDKGPICVPGNSMQTVPGNTYRIEKGQLYIVEQKSSTPQFTIWLDGK